ncbi:MAG: hypothetical protein MR468_03210 [Bacteroides sp.]|nr:hypothetical protein [Bacteroides sp.]
MIPVPVLFLDGFPFRLRTRLVFERVRNQDYIAGGLATGFMGGDQFPAEQVPLCHQDCGPAEAGDVHDGFDRDFNCSLSLFPEAIYHGKDFLLCAS